MLLSEAAIDALLAGRLLAKEALDLGVMRVNNDADGAFLQQLDQALAARSAES